MNPKEFSWKEDQQVTVTNPTKSDYPFKVHNKDYALGAGETAKMPGYIAWVYVYGLASQMCQKAGEFNRWNEEGFRDTYYEKLIVGADDIIEKIEVQPTIEKLELEEETELEENSSDNTAQEPTTTEPVRGNRRGRSAKNQ